MEQNIAFFFNLKELLKLENKNSILSLRIYYISIQCSVCTIFSNVGQPQRTGLYKCLSFILNNFFF